MSDALEFWRVQKWCWAGPATVQGSRSQLCFWHSLFLFLSSFLLKRTNVRRMAVWQVLLDVGSKLTLQTKALNFRSDNRRTWWQYAGVQFGKCQSIKGKEQLVRCGESKGTSKQERCQVQEVTNDISLGQKRLAKHTTAQISTTTQKYLGTSCFMEARELAVGQAATGNSSKILVRKCGDSF